MNRMIRYLLVVSFFVCLLSCAGEFNETFLHGKWETVSWINSSTDEKIENQMDFIFKPDRLYEIDYGSLKEKGEYWISNEFLHTVEDGQVEKKVKIISLTKDSMFFEMNRAGIIEKVIIVKQ